MTVLIAAGAPKRGHLGDNYAWNRHALKRDPNIPIALIKQACPDKAEHHDDIWVAFQTALIRLHGIAFAQPLVGAVLRRFQGTNVTNQGTVRALRAYGE